MISSKNYAGEDCVLVCQKTGKIILKGETRESFRGEIATVTGGRAPHKPYSEGKVYVTGLGVGGEFYPSVVFAEWVPLNELVIAPKAKGEA